MQADGFFFFSKKKNTFIQEELMEAIISQLRNETTSHVQKLDFAKLCA